MFWSPDFLKLPDAKRLSVRRYATTPGIRRVEADSFLPVGCLLSSILRSLASWSSAHQCAPRTGGCPSLLPAPRSQSRKSTRKLTKPHTPHVPLFERSKPTPSLKTRELKALTPGRPGSESSDMELEPGAEWSSSLRRPSGGLSLEARILGDAVLRNVLYRNAM